MDDNDPIVVLNRAATAPEGGWHVFPMQAGSVLIWVVKRFLWSLLLTVLVALGVVALEFVRHTAPYLAGPEAFPELGKLAARLDELPAFEATSLERFK